MSNDKPKNYRLSASALGEYRENPRAFWLAKNHRLERPRGIFSTLPMALDDLVKHRWDNHAGSLPPELLGRVPDGAVLHPDRAAVRALRAWNSAVKAGATWVDPDTGDSLIGALDDVLLLADGRVAPIDAKTNKEPRGADYVERYYQTQADCYALLLREWSRDRAADCCVFAFYAPQGIVPTASGMDLGDARVDMAWVTSVPIVHADAASAERLVREACACLRGPLPPPGPQEEWDTYAMRYARAVDACLTATRSEAAAGQPSLL